jgi:hypothetical protein
MILTVARALGIEQTIVRTGLLSEGSNPECGAFRATVPLGSKFRGIFCVALAACRMKKNEDW